MYRRNNPPARPLFDALESRRLMAAAPLAINFNDEALWAGNFQVAAAEARHSGVQNVRLWIGVDSYDQRPNAWDAVPAFGTNDDGSPGAAQVGRPARTMARAFELARMGFHILLVVNNNTGAAPTSADQVRGLFRHLMNATETPDSSVALASVVDQWEVGNEVDSASYWQPSAAGKTAGLKSYVDNFLIPASDELHSDGDPSTWEKVVSAGVSYSPADLKTILDELAAKNALSAIDYAGFHPYGVYNPAAPASNPIRDNTLLARQYADAVGKPLIATEWNIRGFGNAGANDPAWAKAADTIFRTVIAPNYDSAYYFALVNNWSARGGTTSARPGGLLKHDTTLAVTPTSSIADLQTYYEAPLVAADPFYSMFNGWQSGQVSGHVTAAAGLSNAVMPTATVFIDANNNGTLDDGELSTTTDSAGAYTLRYTTSQLPSGDYSLRVVTSGDYKAADDAVTLTLANLSNATDVNFTVRPTAEAMAAIAVINGALRIESDNSALAGGTVWLDLNNDGVQNANEPTALTGTGGAFSFVVDTRITGTEAATLRALLSNGLIAGAMPVVNLLAGQTQSELAVGVRRPLGSISGYLWNDSNGDGLFNGSDSYTGVRVVFLDTNGNGKLDTGERQTNSDATGNYRFDGLAAGTYNVARVFPSGYRLSNGVNGKLTVALAAGQIAAGVNMGTTSLAVPTIPSVPVTPPLIVQPVVVPPVVVPPVVVPPVVVPPVVIVPTLPASPAGTAAISGKVFPQSSKWNALAAAASWTVFLDTNKNGVLDAGEVFTATRNDLTYAFNGLAAGNYTVAILPPTGWKIVTPASQVFTLTLKAGASKTGQNFVVAKV